ncbi:MAG: hypothetical protein H6604_04415 [Flavobacteriales bacterium]|nr:hypothetical protein [Flavobacteriales bacterium]
MKNNLINYFIIFLISFIIFHFAYGIGIILPTNISWLMDAYHDWGTHYLGWCFYRNEPWTFPIGNITNYNYPIGTNIGYTDSLPLLAIPLKVIEGILPQDFQYFGFWLFLCHFLIGIYAYKICNLYKLKGYYWIFVVIFFIGNPVLIYRGLHPTLCSHWLILGSIYLYLKSFKKNNNETIKDNYHQLILLVLSAWIHPYLTFFIIGFNIILPFKNYLYDKKLTLRQTILFPITSLILTFISWFSIGYLEFGGKVESEVSNSYGLYSLNLHSLYNPMGYSSFLPQLKQVSWHQYEGFMYLGLGIIILLVISTILLLVSIPSIVKNYTQYFSYLPLVIWLLFCTLFSITHIITLDDKILYTFYIPELLMKFGNYFRSIARLFWVVYYMILVSVFLIFLKSKIPKIIQLIVLIGLLILQFYDTKLLFTTRKLELGSYQANSFDKKWIETFKKFDEIIVYPPFQTDYLKHNDYQDFAYFASKTKKPITTAYTGRNYTTYQNKYKDSITLGLKTNLFNKDALFICRKQDLETFALPIKTGKATISKLDNFYLICSSEKAKYLPKLSQEQILEIADIKKNLKINSFKTTSTEKFKNSEINFFIEKKELQKNILIIKGWCFRKNTNDNTGDSIFISLSNPTSTQLTSTKLLKREDITQTFGKQLDDSGFELISTTDSLKKGNYNLGIVIKDKQGILHFADTKEIIPIGFKEFQTPQKLNQIINQENILGYIDNFELKENKITLNGWAIYENINAQDTKIELVLFNKKDFYSCEIKPQIRTDITQAKGKDKFNYDNSGFETKIDISKLPKGEYQVGIHLKNGNKDGYRLTDKTFIKK